MNSFSSIEISPIYSDIIFKTGNYTNKLRIEQIMKNDNEIAKKC